jgi:hypothetical protein
MPISNKHSPSCSNVFIDFDVLNIDTFLAISRYSNTLFRVRSVRSRLSGGAPEGVRPHDRRYQPDLPVSDAITIYKPVAVSRVQLKVAIRAKLQMEITWLFMAMS